MLFRSLGVSSERSIHVEVIAMKLDRYDEMTVEQQRQVLIGFGLLLKYGTKDALFHAHYQRVTLYGLWTEQSMSLIADAIDGFWINGMQYAGGHKALLKYYRVPELPALAAFRILRKHYRANFRNIKEDITKRHDELFDLTPQA